MVARFCSECGGKVTLYLDPRAGAYARCWNCGRHRDLSGHVPEPMIIKHEGARKKPYQIKGP